MKSGESDKQVQAGSIFSLEIFMLRFDNFDTGAGVFVQTEGAGPFCGVVV